MAVCVKSNQDGFVYIDDLTPIENCALFLLERNEMQLLSESFDLSVFDSMAYFGSAFALVVASYFLGYPIGVAVTTIRKL